MTVIRRRKGVATRIVDGVLNAFVGTNNVDWDRAIKHAENRLRSEVKRHKNRKQGNYDGDRYSVDPIQWMRDQDYPIY